MLERLSAQERGSVLVCVLALIPYSLLAYIMSRQMLLASGLYLAILGLYIGWSYYAVEQELTYRNIFSPVSLGIVLIACTASVMLLGWVPPSLIVFIHLMALIIITLFWFVMIAALAQSMAERSEFDCESELPSLTVLVPAYNEEGYVGRTILSLLQAQYPAEKKNIVVIDDGSTDGTYEEALKYESETVTVVRKTNGGKYSALNYGLVFAESEIVATVDADSIVATDALRKIVAPFGADSSIGAVASDVKIFNRGSIVTDCQTMEYIFGINMYRRVFDLFGAVPVVPGCLGAYRWSVLEEINRYDPQTLTEDFDTTLKVLNQGYKVRFSEAVVYTEAPDTWGDLYHQRLRWYRGNIMTLKKHLTGSINPDNQYLSQIHLPWALVSMVFIPFASWVILGTIIYVALMHSALIIMIVFLTFCSIVVLSNLLAVRIEQEDLWYVIYSPLFLIGYKHFHDLIMMKSIFDVLRNRDLGWTRATRTNQREIPSAESLPESQPSSTEVQMD